MPRTAGHFAETRIPDHEKQGGMSQRQFRKAQARLHRPASRRLTKAEEARAEALIWFVLLTKPQREAHAQHALQSRGFTTFSPMEWRWRKAHRTAKNRNPVRHDVPAYPKYVFLGVPDAWRGLPWHMVEDITFIRGYLADSAWRPIRLNGSDVAKVMRASQTPLFEAKPEIEPEAPEVVILPGEFVRVTDGPLVGVEFIAERMEGHEVVVRAVEGEGRTIRVPVEILGRAA